LDVVREWAEESVPHLFGPLTTFEYCGRLGAYQRDNALPCGHGEDSAPIRDGLISSRREQDLTSEAIMSPYSCRRQRFAWRSSSVKSHLSIRVSLKLSDVDSNVGQHSEAMGSFPHANARFRQAWFHCSVFNEHVRGEISMNAAY